jgi:hypothetical protein
MVGNLQQKAHTYLQDNNFPTDPRRKEDTDMTDATATPTPTPTATVGSTTQLDEEDEQRQEKKDKKEGASEQWQSHRLCITVE